MPPQHGARKEPSVGTSSPSEICCAARSQSSALSFFCSFTRPLARVWYLILSASASAGCTVFSIAPFVRGAGSRRVSVCLDVSCRPLSACTRRLVLVVSFVFNRAEKRRRCIHLRPSLSSVVSAGTRARVLGGCAVSFLVLLGAIHRAGHTASGLPRSFISAPVTPRGTGAPCTHVSHRIPCSNPIVFDSKLMIE